MVCELVDCFKNFIIIKDIFIVCIFIYEFGIIMFNMDEIEFKIVVESIIICVDDINFDFIGMVKVNLLFGVVSNKC